MLKKLVITIVGLLVLIGVPLAIKMQQFKVMAATPMVMPPETVMAVEVKEEEWPNSVTTTGTITAVQGVTIAAEVPGRVAKIAFEAGSMVKEGDLILQLDTSTEEAQLRAAEALVQLAKVSSDRARDLLGKAGISQSEFDSAEAQFKQAAAQADNIRTVIEKKTLRAPFAGRLGLRLVNLGQILREGEPITSLQTLDPIYVNFSVPQQRFSLLQTGVTVRVVTDAAPDQVFEGKINAVNPEVDSTTRNARAQATISNVGEKLRSGMFANVEIMLPNQSKILAVPATAVLYAPYGDSVFVVEDKKDEKTGKVEKVLRQQIVRLGASHGDFVAIVSGLKVGETVATSGVFKLRPKQPVVVDNKLAPNAQLNPKPNNT
jgi:membrane fusion protein (multidrug efflux system)